MVAGGDVVGGEVDGGDVLEVEVLPEVVGLVVTPVPVDGEPAIVVFVEPSDVVIGVPGTEVAVLCDELLVEDPDPYCCTTAWSWDS